MTLDRLDVFWDNLTPETSFMALEYFQHLIKQQQTNLVDGDCVCGLPEFTQRLGKYFDMLRHTKDDSQEGLQFVLEQMIKIAMLLDYSDEICRRQMSIEALKICGVKVSNSLLSLTIDLLYQLALNEQDFIEILLPLVINDKKDR